MTERAQAFLRLALRMKVMEEYMLEKGNANLDPILSSALTEILTMADATLANYHRGIRATPYEIALFEDMVTDVERMLGIVQ